LETTVIVLSAFAKKPKNYLKLILLALSKY